MSEAADKEINRWRIEVAIALARKVDAEMLADPPIGWRVIGPSPLAQTLDEVAKHQAVLEYLDKKL